MGKINHQSRAHALLSASGSHRWINCTPSALLEDKHGVKADTPFTREGTLAHEIAEITLRRDLNLISDQEYTLLLEGSMSNELYQDEMLDMVDIYTEYCRNAYTIAFTDSLSNEPINPTYSIEQKLDLSEYIPDSFGTADFLVISNNALEVIDLKYGKGVPVKADWNPQLMIYALGALRVFDLMYAPKVVRMTIVQPRLDNISTFELKTEELLQWAEDTLKPAAKKAFAGDGNLNPGAWCTFCAVKARCRALYEEQCKLAKSDFKKPELLTDEEITEILAGIPLFEAWVKSVKDYAFDQAINHGKVWEGFKVVEGRSNRQWADPDLAGALILDAFSELSEDQIYRSSLEPITAIEKLVGKKRFAAANLTVKPAGAPTLVPESDKRELYDNNYQAKIDFKNE